MEATFIGRGIELLIALLNLYTMYSVRKMKIDKDLIDTLKEENKEQDEIIALLKKHNENLEFRKTVCELQHA